MFGEILGIYLINAMGNYENLKTVNIVEIGPGKGTMMSDILRAFMQLDLLRNV